MPNSILRNQCNVSDSIFKDENALQPAEQKEK